MARVVRFHRFGGPEVLRIEEVDVAPPGPGEVRIRTRALGLNRAEALMRAGAYIETPTLPARLGLEASGTVESLGEGVTGLAIGDAVSVVPPISMIAYPMHGELATIPFAHVVRHPPDLGWGEAAALWMAYLTAHGALIDVCGLRAGDFAAITAASSSVGLAAIQICRKIGATPIAITRTLAKRQALLDAGAAYVIAAAEEDVEARLKEISGIAGVKAVLDAVGGPMVEALAGAASVGGTIIEYGGLSPEPTPFPLFIALSKTLSVHGYLVHETVRSPQKLEAAKAFILEGVQSGDLNPTISKRFAFDDIVGAHRHLESNDQFGKVVITV